MGMSLSHESEQQMYELALNFELETGNRIRWRNAPAGIAALLNLALQSGKPELVNMANHVVEGLSGAILSELERRGLALPGCSVYRGAKILEEEAPVNYVTKELTYRGARYLSQVEKEEQMGGQKKSPRRYRGQIIDD